MPLLNILLNYIYILYLHSRFFQGKGKDDSQYRKTSYQQTQRSSKTCKEQLLLILHLSQGS